MPVLINARQEIFTQNWFEAKPITEAAIIAGYKPNWAASIASRLSRKVKILARYNELQEQAASKKVASKQERMEILSEILRAKPEDYMELSEDGRDLQITREALKSPAVSYIRTEQVALGKMPVRLTRVGLIDKTKAADLLNKMDGIYAPETKQVYNDIKIMVVYDNSDKRSKGNTALNGTTP